MLRQLLEHRDLVVSLVRRQFFLRYRQSFAGPAWAIVPPLATMLMATLVFHRIAGVESGDTPYMLFTLAALTPWTLFASSITVGVPSIVSASQMITRVPFPRSALPVSMMGTAVIDVIISGVVFVVFLYATGSYLPMTALWFPLFVAIELLFATGVVLLLSALNVFARDVKQAVPLTLQLWLFLTPVMYPLPKDYEIWYLLNPMTGIIESFRRALLPPGPGPVLHLLLPALLGTATFLVLGSWYFSATQHRFADVI